MPTAKFCLLLLLWPLLFIRCHVSNPPQSNLPNIILFFVDDLGWQDTSVPFWNQPTAFNQRYRTPNMERLASQGMKFTQAYATPVCSPTRVSLLTGMNAARHRVTNWTLYKDKIQPMESNHPTLRFPFWNVNGLSADTSVAHAVHATPLPQLLKEAGYQTIHCGKAHFGAIGCPGENPLHLGFEVNIAGHAAGAPQSYYGLENFGNTDQSKGSPWPVPGLEQYHGQDINLTEVLTKEALKAIEAPVQNGQPFFLYMAHYTVHTPIMADHPFFQSYLDQGLDTIEAKYASMIEGMDQSLGQLMDYVEEQQIADNTIVLFMSDNGGLSAVARGGEKHSHNRPLASGKGSIYEGGIREPMLVRWPGRVPAGSSNASYLIIEDFYPSILEMAGIQNYQSLQQIDGQSFVPFIDRPHSKPQERPLYWHYPNFWGAKGPGIGAFSAIRQGDFKLIYFHEGPYYELYNIREDIGEQDNLIDQSPEKAKALAKRLGDYLRSVDAQMPADKESGLMIPYPGAG